MSRAMHVILDVVLPVFAILLAGYLAGALKLLGESSSEALNRFVYYIGFPPLLFLAMARVPVAEVLHWPFLAAYGGGFFAVYALAMGVGVLFAGRDLRLQNLQGLTASFANTGYMGLPLYLTAFGQEGALPAVIATVFNAVVAVGFATMVAEIARREHGSALRAAGVVAGANLRNPLLVAPALGLAASALAVPLPTPVVTFCELLGATAGPSALFAIGLFLVGKPLRSGLGELSWLVAAKLVIQPAVTAWLAFVVFPMERHWAVAAVIMSALPVGALAFVLAQRYGVYTQRSSTAILVTTVVSFATLSALMIHFGI